MWLVLTGSVVFITVYPVGTGDHTRHTTVYSGIEGTVYAGVFPKYDGTTRHEASAMYCKRT